MRGKDGGFIFHQRFADAENLVLSTRSGAKFSEKQHALNDDDLQEFIEFQSTFKLSERSWFLDLEEVESGFLRSVGEKSQRAGGRIL
ncbi:MAG UNVERIFIED_CONTAM: hypothetical protein LVR29_24755 [Microcystis novacekii LVE1205-3]